MSRRRHSPPVVLTIAGSDNSCGAGAQADLKVITAHKCYAQSAITCVVAEIPGHVAAIHPVPPDVVAQQAGLSLKAFPIRAAKTGMLYSAAIVKAVAGVLSETSFPLVVDPVMVASSGDPLLKPNAIAAYRDCLFPLATLLTPNLDELQLLAGGVKIKTYSEMRDLALAFANEVGCAVLAKGGHLGGPTARDILVAEGCVHEFSAPFVRGISPHGTGCTYSAAIASNLALGLPLVESVDRAKHYITAAIRGFFKWKETAALNHSAA